MALFVGRIQPGHPAESPGSAVSDSGSNGGNKRSRPSDARDLEPEKGLVFITGPFAGFYGVAGSRYQTVEVTRITTETDSKN